MKEQKTGKQETKSKRVEYDLIKTVPKKGRGRKKHLKLAEIIRDLNRAIIQGFGKV
jgi:hypothetical protein